MNNRIVYFLFLFIVSVSTITAAGKREFKAGTEIDDSSYESLFRAAYSAELQGDSAYPDPKTLEALVRFDRVDLIYEVISPYKKDASKEDWRLEQDRYIVQTPVVAVAEQLFRLGRIDEAVALLEKLLPPQEPEDGMLCVGFVSEPLLEQKRFEPAWKLADCGSLQERAASVSRMIQRLIAKTRREMEPYFPSHTPKPAPWQPKEEDNPIYRKEAEKGLKRLEEIHVAVQDERVKEWIMKGNIAQSLAVLGRYDEAYEIVRNDSRRRFDILANIVEDCFRNGDKDALERWFKLFRESFEKGEHGGGIDYDGRMHYLWPCIRIGKYLDALDVIEKNPPPPGQQIMGGSGSYMFRAYLDIARKNIETDFRYNSPELVRRLIGYHEKTKDPEEKKKTLKSGRKTHVIYLSRYNDDRFFSKILKAQLALGQVDAAVESLKRISGVIESYNSMADIAVYCTKNKPLKEAERIEKQLLKIFAQNEEARQHAMVEWYTVDFLAETAARLLADGLAEPGNRYLERAVEQAEKCHQRSEKEEKTKFDSSSNLGTVCGKLLAHNLPDEAAKLVERFADRYTMAGIRLEITKKYADGNEHEKAKKSLRKTFAAYSKTKFFFPPQLNRDYGAMAALAVSYDEKDLFYRIMEEGLRLGDEHHWFGPNMFTLNTFDTYARRLAKYGDANHPLFAKAEKIGDGFKADNSRSDLYLSLGIARSMLGDHPNARRLLKKGIESRKQDKLGMTGSACPSIIEAASYETKTKK